MRISQRKKRGVLSGILAIFMVASGCEKQEPPATRSAASAASRSDQGAFAEAVVVVFLLARNKAREKQERSHDETAQEQDKILPVSDRTRAAVTNAAWKYRSAKATKQEK